MIVSESYIHTVQKKKLCISICIVSMSSLPSFPIRFMFFTMLVAITTYRDPTLPQCRPCCGKIALLCHHALSYYILGGSFVFGYSHLHIWLRFFALITFAVSYQCPITRVQNTLCHLPDDTLHHNSRTVLHVNRFLYLFLAAFVLWYDLRHF
jgi:hypothetical protein